MPRKRYEIIASTFDKKGNLIASGMNSYRKTHPLMRHFAKLAGEHEAKTAIHAELQAMLRSKGKEVHSILVQRFDAFGNPAMSRPCASCISMLKAFGVKEAVYTVKGGTSRESVKDMIGIKNNETNRDCG